MSHKGQCRTCPRLLCREHPCKVTTWYGNLRKVIAFTRSSPMLSAWKFIKLTQRSRSNLVEILMSRTSLPVHLQHEKANSDALSYSQEAARCCHLNMTYFINIELIRDFVVENIFVKLQNDTGNSCRVSIHKGSLTLSYFLKVQKCHTKVNVEHVQDFYVENIHVKLEHDTGNLRRVITFTRFRTPPAHPPVGAQATIPSSLRGWGVKMFLEKLMHF